MNEMWVVEKLAAFSAGFRRGFGLDTFELKLKWNPRAFETNRPFNDVEIYCWDEETSRHGSFRYQWDLFVGLKNIDQEGLHRGKSFRAKIPRVFPVVGDPVWWTTLHQQQYGLGDGMLEGTISKVCGRRADNKFMVEVHYKLFKKGFVYEPTEGVIDSVLFYPDDPGNTPIPASHWQVCWPRKA